MPLERQGRRVEDGEHRALGKVKRTSIKQLYIEDSQVTHAVRRNMRSVHLKQDV